MCSEAHAQKCSRYDSPPLGSEEQDGAMPVTSQSSVVNAPSDAPVWLQRSRGGSVYADWLLLTLLGDGNYNAGLCLSLESVGSAWPRMRASCDPSWLVWYWITPLEGELIPGPQKTSFWLGLGQRENFRHEVCWEVHCLLVVSPGQCFSELDPWKTGGARVHPKYMWQWTLRGWNTAFS